MPQKYYEIMIKDNDFGVIYTIDYDTYKLFENTFETVYHTKKGDAFKMDCEYEKGIVLLIVDDDHLKELLDDMKEGGFCDTENLYFNNHAF